MAGLEMAKDLGRISADEFDLRIAINSGRRERLRRYVSSLQRVLSPGANQVGRQGVGYHRLPLRAGYVGGRFERNQEGCRDDA